jgi:hypothetical protein
MENGGLIDKLTFILLLNAIVPIARILVIEPPIWVDYFKKKQADQFLESIDAYKKEESLENMKKVLEGKIFTHEKILAAKLGQRYNISDHYATVFSATANALFYFQIFPFGVVFALVTFIGMYYASKVAELLTLVRFDKSVHKGVQVFVQNLEIVEQRNGLFSFDFFGIF